ncbi:hypothetical protein M4D57_20505 [Brevibacillus borstelensis]|nr:hypothetical protein [Brevibacillus borstelensis]MCM3560949.1 hypothetical protein [Brevibacillus borstelensis]
MGAEPIAKRDRIFSIDIVRGIALFGILIVNMPSFLTLYGRDADAGRDGD